jgi:hypothetical protein
VCGNDRNMIYQNCNQRHVYLTRGRRPFVTDKNMLGKNIESCPHVLGSTTALGLAPPRVMLLGRRTAITVVFMLAY